MSYPGAYSNERPKHVEVGSSHLHAYKAGTSYFLKDLREHEGAYIWTVDGMQNAGHPAHFTIAYGKDKGPLHKYSWNLTPTWAGNFCSKEHSLVFATAAKERINAFS